MSQADTVDRLPAGFSQSFVLYSGNGVTATIHEWGALLQVRALAGYPMGYPMGIAPKASTRLGE